MGDCLRSFFRRSCHGNDCPGVRFNSTMTTKKQITVYGRANFAHLCVRICRTLVY